MKVTTRRLTSWALAILLVGIVPTQWWHRREAKKAQQLYYALDARYLELITIAVRDSDSVKDSDLNSAEQALDSARTEYEARDSTSDTLTLWMLAIVAAHLIFGWLSDRIDARRDRTDTA